MTSDVVLDLSHHQDIDSWQAIVDAGIVAVTLKATQGSHYVDPTFSQRVGAAMNVGLLIGAYHFLDGTDPARQTDLFYAVAGGLPRLFFDCEANPDPEIGGTATVDIAAEAVTIYMNQYGEAPGIYIGRYGPDGAGTELPDPTLAMCPLWVPNYTTAASPNLPPGWSTWTLWQYTQTGSVPGIYGSVDRNRFNGTVEELRQWWIAGVPIV